MEATTILGWQWDSPTCMLTVWPLLWFILVLSLGYLTIRLLLAGLRFLNVLTIYFEQRTENERRNDEE